MTAMLGLPLMALGQTAEPQQAQEQAKETQTTAPTKGKKEQTKETQTTAPTKGKKIGPDQEQTNPQAKPETGQNANVQGSAQDVNRNESRTRSSTSKTNVNQSTTVNKEEFKSRHSEVFSLGRHPKEFFVQRFGANHVRLIENTFFVFVDSCWVAVDVDGFVFSERLICAGDPDFIEVD